MVETLIGAHPFGDSSICLILFVLALFGSLLSIHGSVVPHQMPAAHMAALKLEVLHCIPKFSRGKVSAFGITSAVKSQKRCLVLVTHELVDVRELACVGRKTTFCCLPGPRIHFPLKHWSKQWHLLVRVHPSPSTVYE